ncbi:sigma-70 family RNA polymerase sigma factor [Pedobacter antarcticus]|uniref:RNA polymerase sigma factor n=1 Tax=Pedobacter antarcticus TaxID=34086 RepID=UPI00292E6BD1|nr:sigma-70 family RNA polymerase sigma factor [Pedobacter antarcticus]
MNREKIIKENLPEPGQDDNERRAYTDLIKKYSKQLFDFGYRFCPDEDIVKDCIQQLYLDLWNRRFDISESSTIKSYLFKAIRNRVLREKSKWFKDELLDDDYGFVLEFAIDSKLITDTANLELAEKVRKAIQTLPARQREIIYLKFFEDLDIQQISSIMNINKQSAHNLLQKAYSSLRADWSVLLLLFATTLQLYRS